MHSHCTVARPVDIHAASYSTKRFSLTLVLYILVLILIKWQAHIDRETRLQCSTIKNKTSWMGFTSGDLRTFIMYEVVERESHGQRTGQWRWCTIRWRIWARLPPRGRDRSQSSRGSHPGTSWAASPGQRGTRSMRTPSLTLRGRIRVKV